MKKLTAVSCALLLSVCGSIPVFGKGVDEGTAKKVGANFLMSNGVGNVSSVQDLTTYYKATAQVNGNVVTDYYVFNFTKGSGYIMVAGDDIAEPILAYSTEWTFNTDKIAPAAKEWFDGYQSEINNGIEKNLSATPEVTQKWSDYQVAFNGKAAKTTAVSPLVTTKWDQVPNYNYLCPGTGSGKAVTGCVATAMAQIMKYWNWPAVGAGYHTYSHATYGAVSANFGNTAYNWAGMPNSISTNNVNIGTLMFHAGVAVDMNYSPLESGAYTIQEFSPVVNCAEYALKTYFRYKSTLKGLSRSANPPFSSGYSQVAWMGFLTSELDAGRPLLYTGRSATAGGHAWVCDGYNATSMMHFNFGWGGMSDGYFNINSVVVAGVGTGGGSGDFNSMQTIIMGIMPDSSSSSTWGGNLKMLSKLNCTTNSPMAYMSPFSVTAKILNAGTSVYKGDFCAQVFDVNNTYLGTMQTAVTGQTINAGDSSAVLTFSTTGMYGMIPGTSPHTLASRTFVSAYYGIRVMFKPTGSSTWTPVSNNSTFINFNQMGVVNSNDVALYDSISIAGGSHFVNKGSAFTLTTKVAALGAAFSGTVDATLFNIYTGGAYPVEVKSGESIGAGAFKLYTFTTSSLTAPGGTYVLGIRHQPGSTGTKYFTGSQLYFNPVFVTVIGGVEINTPSLDADKISVYPNPANADVFVEVQGGNARSIVISDISGRTVRSIDGLTGQSLITVPVDGISPGMYLMQIHGDGAVVTKKIVVSE